MNLARKNIAEIKPYTPGRPIQEVARELGLQPQDICKLASNENPLGPSPMVIDAIKKNADKINIYPDGNCFYLRQKLSEKMGIDPDWFIFGNGSNDVIEIIAKTFLNSDDEMITAWPAFVVYKLVAKMMDIKEIAVPLKDFYYNLDAMTEKITDKTKIIALCNPNNPTGTMFTANEFDRFMQKVPEDIIVVVDEAYYEFLTIKNYPDTLKHLKNGRNIIILRTFSKAYGLAGLRIGYGITKPELVIDMNKVRQPFNVNSLAQIAAIAALEDLDHIQKTRDNNKQGLEYIMQELDKKGIKYVPSVANFLLVDVGKDKADEKFKELMQKGVIVRSMAGYGLPDYVRVTVGLPEENKKFIERSKP